MQRFDTGAILGRTDRILRKASGVYTMGATCNSAVRRTAFYSLVVTVLLCIFTACSNKTEPDENAEPPVVTTETVTFKVNSFENFTAQHSQIVDAAKVQTTMVVVDFASFGVSQENINALTAGIMALCTASTKATTGYVLKPNVKINYAKPGLYPKGKGIVIKFEEQWEPLQKPPLTANPDKWEVSPTDLPKFNAAGQSAAVEVKGSDNPNPPVGQNRTRIKFSDLEKLYPNTVASADTIDIDKDSDIRSVNVLDWNKSRVVLMPVRNVDEPGAQFPLVNMNSEYLKQLCTEYSRALEPGHTGKLYCPDNMLVTKFSLNGEFVQDPDKALKIGKLGDAGVTDFEFTHLMKSWSMVGNARYMPHVQSTNADGKIYFEPGQHFIDEAGTGRSKYAPEWFTDRAAFFAFGKLNNVTVIIEMKKIAFCAPWLNGTNSGQHAASAYQYLGGAFSKHDPYIQCPSMADVIAYKVSQNTIRK
jgi:hypothetical protein